MSVLDNNKNRHNEDAIRRANQIKTGAAQLADQLTRQWNTMWDCLWESPDPIAVIEELGTDAGELFELNDHLINFFKSSLAQRRQEQLEQILAKVALKPATTIHDDGTATIDL